MKSSLPTHFNSTILVCHDKARPYVMQVAPSIQSHTHSHHRRSSARTHCVPLSPLQPQAVILGPPDTPYDSGMLTQAAYS